MKTQNLEINGDWVKIGDTSHTLIILQAAGMSAFEYFLATDDTLPTGDDPAFIHRKDESITFANGGVNVYIRGAAGGSANIIYFVA